VTCKRALAGLAPAESIGVNVIGVEPYAAMKRSSLRKPRNSAARRRRSQGDTLLILSAHSCRAPRSLPRSVQTLFEASARAIAAKLGWDAQIVYQSQVPTAATGSAPPWTTPCRRSRRGKRAVAWRRFGFLADHVETLYD